MEGALSYEMAGIIAGACAFVAAGVAGVFVRYYSEKSAIVSKIDSAIDAIEQKWDAKFEAHRIQVTQSHKEIHDRIERVEQRWEDRLSKRIDEMRSEMERYFGQVLTEIKRGIKPG